MDGQPSFLSSYLAPLADLLARPDLVELAVNPDGRVWMERKGGAHMEPVPDARIDRDLSVNYVMASVRRA